MIQLIETGAYSVAVFLSIRAAADRRLGPERVVVCLLGQGPVRYSGTKLYALFESTATPISTSSILISVGFAIAVGVFFGYYPATRASRLNPADALGYE
jgi:putative ABC transport system permease protein